MRWQIKEMAHWSAGALRIQGELASAVLTFFDEDASMSVAAEREGNGDGRTQTTAFEVSPTPAADEAEAVSPGHSPVAGSVVSARTRPVCVPLATLPAQLTISGFGEEAEVRGCIDDLPLELKLAYKGSGGRSELAFLVLPPEWPELKLPIAAVQWHPSRKDVLQDAAPTDSEADTGRQHRATFWKCIKSVGILCRDTCCYSEVTCILSCFVGVVLPLFFILSLCIIPSRKDQHHSD